MKKIICLALAIFYFLPNLFLLVPLTLPGCDHNFYSIPFQSVLFKSLPKQKSGHHFHAPTKTMAGFSPLTQAAFSAQSLLRLVYPSATSRAIMRVNPAANNSVAMLEWLPSDISGISSSTTTYIMAPAAKLSRQGKTGTTSSAARTVSAPARGSTTPEAAPCRKALMRDSPSECSGIEIMAPSGKF